MTQEPEDLAQVYSAAMDSVNLINDYAAKPQPLVEDDKATVKRNVGHLEIIVAKTVLGRYSIRHDSADRTPSYTGEQTI